MKTTRDTGPNNNFVFSDDIEIWMHSPKVSQDEKDRQAGQRARRKNEKRQENSQIATK